MNIVWPVNRSEPAKITRVSAMPNEHAHDDRADTGIDLVADREDQDDAEADIGAGHHRADRRSRRGDRFRKAALAAAVLANWSTVSRNISFSWYPGSNSQRIFNVIPAFAG